MLRFKQFIKLLEELNPAQKQSVSSWLGSSTTIPDDQIKASQNAIDISKHLIPENTDHIIMRAVSPLIRDVNVHLKKHGYEIHDYAYGTARKIGDEGKTISLPVDQLKTRIKKDRIKDSNLQYDAEQHAHNEARKIFNPQELEQYNNVYNSEHGGNSPHETAMAQFDDKKRQHYNTIFNLAKQNFLKPHLDKDVTDEELKNTGFHIQNGIASRKFPTKTESIGSILEKTEADPNLINDFANDNRELGQNIHNYNLVISRNPYHIAECSTNKPWYSCAQMGDDGKLNNLASKHLPDEIKEGTHVAYLVHKDHEKLPVQQQIDHAISRVLLKPFVSENGHRILSPENASYTSKETQTGEGDVRKNVSMINLLKIITDKYFPLLDDEYTKPGNLYNDDKISKLYSPEYKKVIQNKLMDKIKSGEWKISDISEAVKNNVFSNEHHKELQNSYLERLKSNYPISREEIAHAKSLGYHKDKKHLEALKDNITRQLSYQRYDLNNAESVINHSIDNDYFDKRYLEALKMPLLKSINEGEYGFVGDAKRYGFWDDNVHEKPLYDNFHDDLRHWLKSNNPLSYYETASIKRAIDHGYFDHAFAEKVQNNILDYIKSNDHYDRHVLNNIFDAGLMTREHLNHMIPEYKTQYEDKFNKADDFLRDIKSEKYFPTDELDNALDGGYYNIKMHKHPIHDKLTEILHMYNDHGIYPQEILSHAIKKGYFDWDKHRKLAQQSILKQIKNSDYHIYFDKSASLWDDDIHKIPFQKQFLEDIKNGKYSTKAYDDAGMYNMLTKEHHKAMSLGLLKKIESGEYGIEDIAHAQKHNYFNEEHKQALPMGLSKQLDDPSGFTWQFNLGRKYNIENAINNGYFNEEHKQKITKIFHNLLKSGNLKKDLINHAHLYGYFPTDSKFLEDYYNREKQ